MRMRAWIDLIAEGIVTAYLGGIWLGGAGLAILWMGHGGGLLYPHRYDGRHRPALDRPNWWVIVEARELVDLPPAAPRRDRLVVPRVYETLADLSSYTRALRSMRLRSARYTPER